MRPKTRPENPMNNMKQVLTSFGLLAAGIGLARGNEGLKVRFEMRSQECAARKRYVPGVPTSFRQKFSKKYQNFKKTEKICESLFTF